MKTEPQWDTASHPPQWLLSKNIKNPWWGCGEIGTLAHCRWDCKEENYTVIPLKTKSGTTMWFTIKEQSGQVSWDVCSVGGENSQLCGIFQEVVFL